MGNKKDELPHDPMHMPPPYWRGGGAIFHIVEALSEIPMFLQRLYSLLPIISESLERYDNKWRDISEDEVSDEELEEFSEIVDPLNEVEHRAELRCEIVTLMSAIGAEDELNMVSVYNLPRGVSEVIERLTIPDKLVAVAGFLDHSVKGTAIYSDIRSLAQWRNRFAHGHCVDRPTRTLRYNHLIAPVVYPDFTSTLETMKKHVHGFLRLADYLRSISRNPYTSARNSNYEEVRWWLTRIEAIKVTPRQGIPKYDITLPWHPSRGTASLSTRTDCLDD